MSALNLAHPDQFAARHLGPSESELAAMLPVVGVKSLAELADKTVPASIRLGRSLNLPTPCSEFEALAELRGIASGNKVFRSYIGMGYYDTITPPVIQRNILENPGWYTQYTPYQAEISQGRLESLLNYQTMVCDLTGLDIANASLLDEGTAAAEAMTMAYSIKGNDTKNVIFIADTCHPQTINVVVTRAKPVGIEVRVGNPAKIDFDGKLFAVLVQYPDTFGAVTDYTDLFAKTHAADAITIAASDLLALTLLKSPGELGADIAVGSAQRFGVPLGYGGPHAAFFSTRDAFKRQMPGRIVGVSKDARGKAAFRLSLQTREQHIRRDKATSNICTAQALLANMAAMYACYHGPKGLKAIAQRVHGVTTVLAVGLSKLGLKVEPAAYFDTLRVSVKDAASVHAIAEKHGINLRKIDGTSVGLSVDETVSARDITELWQVFNGDKAAGFSVEDVNKGLASSIPAALQRTSEYLSHKVFNLYHSETEMLRYLRKLESRDLSLTHSMIPLGSCTMKLNATVEMFPVSWPEFGKLHPFAPLSQTQGYLTMFQQLEQWLAEITGFDAISLQPNAGSAGEYAGLMAIHAYHQSKGQVNRDICLIPTSAHGTNPASAVMAGLKVIPVACDKEGNIDVADLRAKAEQYKDTLSCLMITYPSTHGVFEESIKDICQIIHSFGGQVYMDGANMNAQVGLCRPGDIGADVCHLNLHKTFCIPHGGGGPGMGPIGVAKHLTPFLPGHPVIALEGQHKLGAIAAAPWGSASILTISWVYIRLMGPAGVTDATKFAILNANYIAKRLQEHFPILYKGKSGLVAHECILDLRQFKAVTAEDVAKRLMDYGFHAPTLSWPVAGTLMVEPTESESQAELDRFCDAMLAIHAEIQAVETGAADKANNPLKNAPHTADTIASDAWNRPYTREQAAFPRPWLKDHKFWPAVGRIDNVFGDRNPVCTCVGMEAYQ